MKSLVTSMSSTTVSGSRETRVTPNRHKIEAQRRHCGIQGAKGKAVSEGHHGAGTVEWTEEVIFKDQF